MHIALFSGLTGMRLRFAGALAFVLLAMAWKPAAADPARIVAVGASNTWGVGCRRAECVSGAARGSS